MIDDRIEEEGFTEEDAVAAVGAPEHIAKDILRELPLQTLVAGRIKPKRALRAWEILLLVLGAPIWMPLVLSILVIIISLYLSLWAILLSLWVADLSFSVAGLALLIFCFSAFFSAGNIAVGILELGSGIAFLSLSVLLFFAFKYLTNALIRIAGKALLGLKNALVRKGESR